MWCATDGKQAQDTGGFLTGTGTSAPELKLGFGTPQPKALSLPGWGRAEERLSMKAEFLCHIMDLSNHKAGGLI